MPHDDSSPRRCTIHIHMYFNVYTWRYAGGRGAWGIPLHVQWGISFGRHINLCKLYRFTCTRLCSTLVIQYTKHSEIYCMNRWLSKEISQYMKMFMCMT